MNILSIHSGHDANVVVFSDGKFHIIELERFFNERHLEWMRPATDGLTAQKITTDLAAYIKQRFPGEFREGILTHNRVPPVGPLPVPHWVFQDHHHSHAAAAFYQST